jgi:starch synthase
LANILLVSAEAAPFAKVGGMADVVGSLPAALRRLGTDARVVLPGYGHIRHDKYSIEPFFTFAFTHRQGSSTVQVYTTVHDGVPFYFLQIWPYFGTERTVYTEWSWDVPRFILFNQAVMAFAWEMRARDGWFPDVFHVNDWHTGLVPFLIEANRWTYGWGEVASMLSIHNLAYQGNYAGGFLFQAGVPGRHHPDLVYQDLGDNLLAIAIGYSTVLSTVSPRYAIEIQYPYMGYGLDGLIRRRISDLYGILNGIDTALYNPETDPRLHSNFSADNFETMRPPNKAQLQRLVGLPERPEVPLVGIVSRLVAQKGIDLLVPAMRRILSERDAQFVALGTGEAEFEGLMGALGAEYWSRGARVLLKYDDDIAQHIYAGCDIFVMPSHFEPCGTGQMLAMRYGALPLVRETGGLADTVDNYDNGEGGRGVGFVFSWQQPEAVYYTLRWALDTYHNRPEVWARMQARAMRLDFGWERSAGQYIDLYERAIRNKRERGW